jgi:hypothetical protein
MPFEKFKGFFSRGLLDIFGLKNLAFCLETYRLSSTYWALFCLIYAYAIET